LTGVAVHDGLFSSPGLEHQLKYRGLSYRKHQISIGDLNRPACLFCYDSPRTGRPITALVVFSQLDDPVAADYFYFEGLAEREALEHDWATIHEACVELLEEAKRQRRQHGDETLGAADVEINTVLVEAHDGVRWRVLATSEILRIITIVPIDNPLPTKRGNAPGRKPITIGWNHIGTTWRVLRGELADLDTAAYAARQGLEAPGVDWVAY
jgi:hypothetical protein